jgi:hypothetical protein
MDDDEIRLLVGRLSRPDGAGGVVIERASIMAAGADSAAILGWITAHGGYPEAAVPLAARQGLHSARLSDSGGIGGSAPRRYRLPADALS